MTYIDLDNNFKQVFNLCVVSDIMNIKTDNYISVHSQAQT